MSDGKRGAFGRIPKGRTQIGRKLFDETEPGEPQAAPDYITILRGQFFARAFVEHDLHFLQRRRMEELGEADPDWLAWAARHYLPKGRLRYPPPSPEEIARALAFDPATDEEWAPQQEARKGMENEKR